MFSATFNFVNMGLVTCTIGWSMFLTILTSLSEVTSDVHHCKIGQFKYEKTNILSKHFNKTSLVLTDVTNFAECLGCKVTPLNHVFDPSATGWYGFVVSVSLKSTMNALKCRTLHAEFIPFCGQTYLRALRAHLTGLNSSACPHTSTLSCALSAEMANCTNGFQQSSAGSATKRFRRKPHKFFDLLCPLST